MKMKATIQGCISCLKGGVMNRMFSFFRVTASGRFLIPAGIILTVFGFVLMPIVNETGNWDRTEATVTRTELAETEYDQNGEHHEATYSTFVSYIVGEETYEELLGELSGYKEGDTIQIVYDPDQPERLSQPVGMILPFALIGGGIAALVVGVISIIAAVRKAAAMRVQEKEWSNGR